MTDFVDKDVLSVDVDRESNIVPANAVLIENVTRKLTLEEFDEKLTLCKSLGERIKFVKKFYKWVPVQPGIIAKYSKNTQTSAQFRDRGNDSFKKNSIEDALLNYNLAIMFAPVNSEELGLAYANRAAVLMKLEDFPGSLADIDLAVSNNYPSGSIQKLKDRRSKCERMLKKKEAENDPEEKNEVQSDRANRRKFCEGILFKVKKPNPSMPAAEDFVHVKYDEVEGRHLVVTRDIPAGTVLIVEKPYVSVLKNEVKWDSRHCHYCLKSLRRGIPCKNCVFAFYCDESCLEKAEREYHKYECPCMSYLHCNSSPRWILLVFRIICKVGPQELLRIHNTKDPSYFDTKASSPFGTDPNNSSTYDSDSYLPIHHLVGHSDELDGGSRYANALQALLLTSILQVQSDFFNEIPPEVLSEFSNFVATLMLRHIESIPCNAISLDEVTGLGDISLEDCYGNRVRGDRLAAKIRHIEYPQFAAGVYSACSLMNHSCDPNVDRENDLVDGTLAVVATRALKTGEAIVTCYARNFVSDPLEKRQSYLLENYYFKCECVACENDWPCLDEMMGREPIFSCSTCSAKFAHEEKGSSRFLKCALTPSSWTCGLCGTAFKEKEQREQFDANMAKTFEAYELVLKNRPYEAIRKLMGPMKYFQFNVCPPYSKWYWNHETYKQALALMVYFSC